MSQPQTILLKLSGELFKSQQQAVDLGRVLEVAREIAKIKKDYRLGIVFGGGNIFRGRNVAQLGLNMVTAHLTGMTATVVNALALKNAFDKLKIANRIMSALAMPQLVSPGQRLDIPRYLDQGQILIFAGGTGNPFVTTDTCAVIRALEMEADLILKGTSVSGIYDHNPQQNPAARQFKQLPYGDYLNLEKAYILDKTAVLMAAENNLPIYVFKWGKASLKRAVKLKAGGTLIK